MCARGFTPAPIRGRVSSYVQFCAPRGSRVHSSSRSFAQARLGNDWYIRLRVG